MPLINVNHTQLYVESAGSGPAFFMLHGHLLDHRQWDDQLAHFQDRYRIIRYDARGYGDSAAQAIPFYHHHDLLALYNHFQINQAILMGCSGGGAITLDFALTYPDRVSALILLGSGLANYRSTIPPDQVMIEMGAAWQLGNVEKAVELSLKALTAGQNRSLDQVNPIALDRTRQMTTKLMQRKDNPNAHVKSLTPFTKDRLNEIEAPTLILLGSEDQPGLHEISQKLAEEIPHNQFEILPNGCHHPNLEMPQRYNQIVEQFLDSISV